MGKICTDNFMDAALDWLNGSATGIVVTNASAYDASATVTSACLASATLSSSGTKNNGDTSGRKITWPSKSGTTITASGTATHIVLRNTNGSALYQTTCTSQALTSGTVDIPAWDIEVYDPA